MSMDEEFLLAPAQIINCKLYHDFANNADSGYHCHINRRIQIVQMSVLKYPGMAGRRLLQMEGIW